MAKTMQISQQGIAKASIILIFSTMLSRFFGFLREVVIADKFGASATTDAFFVALTIPVLQSGDSAACSFAWRFTKLLGFAFVLLSLGLYFCSPNLVALIAPGLTESAHNLAVHLMKFLSFLVILLGLTAVLESIYNGFEHFITPAFTPIALNCAVILAVIIYADRLGPLGIVLGFLVGGTLQFLILSRVFRIYRFSFRDKLHIAEPAMRKVFHLGVFIFLVQATWGSYLVVDRILASSLLKGSISALAFADRLIQLPVGVFVLALSIAVLPRMSISVAQKDYRRVERICSAGLRLLLFVIVPISILFCIMRFPLIRVLYQRGSFDANATRLTAGPLLAYSLGLCAFSGQIFILRVYFAFQDTVTPILTGLISLGIKIVLSLVLVRIFAVTGIALATSIAASVNTALLALMLVKKGHVTKVFDRWRSLEKLSLGWLLLGVVSFFVFRSFGHLSVSPQYLADIIQIAGTVILGSLVYIGTMALLRAEEIARIKEALWSRSIFRTSPRNNP
jgi:putative peptidoglycan lipid II flippase